MADSTRLPALSQISFFNWSRPDAPNPRMSAPISTTTQTTLNFTSPPEDEDGNVVATAFLMGVRNSNSYVETMLVPTGRLNYDAQTANFAVGDVLTGGTSAATAIIVRDTDNGTTGSLDLVVLTGTFQNNETITTVAGGSATSDGTLTGALSADGLTATGVVRGIDIMGLDWTTTDTTFAATHEQDSPVFCNITGVMEAILFAALQGTLATGGSNFIIGVDAAGTVTVSRSSGVGTNLGFVRWNTANSAAEFSNDGAVWNRIDDVVAGSLVVVTGADTTPSNLQTKVQARGGLAESVGTPAGDERLILDLNLTANTGNITAGLLATLISDVTATAAEINQVLDGVSANVTVANLNTLTAGAASNADALHTHATLTRTIAEFTAGETLAAGDTVYINGVSLTTIEADNDAYVEEANPATVFNNTNLSASFPNAGATRARSYLHFDISAQPASVYGVYLRLFVSVQASVAVAGGRRIRIENLNGVFDETTLTWNNQPGVDGTTVDCTYGVRDTYPVNAPMIFDVTTIYNTLWNTNNFGLRIWWDNEAGGAGANAVSFGSRTNGTASNRPDLILVQQDANYGRVYACSSGAQVVGMKGIVVVGGNAGETVSVQIIGTYNAYSGLTPYNTYEASTLGGVSTTNVIQSQFLALSATTVKMLDKRREYASDVMTTQVSVYDLDQVLIALPAAMMIDNQTNNAAASSVTYNINGWLLGTPTDNGVTTRAVGMTALDVLG